MEDKVYQVVFEGKLVEGADADKVKKKLAAMFKMSPEKIKQLFSGKRHIVKKNVPMALSQKIEAKFQKAGAICIIEEMGATQGEQDSADIQEAGKLLLSMIKVQEEEDPNRIPADKKTTILLTIFLGLFGTHKFYLGKTFQGIFYLALCWSGAGLVFSLLDLLVFAFTKNEKFQKKYSKNPSNLMNYLSVCIGISLIIIEIVLFIIFALPVINEYRTKEFKKSFEFELHNIRVAQEIYRLDHNTYSKDLNQLEYEKISSNNIVEIVEASNDCFTARVRHEKLNVYKRINCKGEIQLENTIIE